MPLSDENIERLNNGWTLVAELPHPSTHMRAYVVVVPQVPPYTIEPALWLRAPKGRRRLLSASAITGYEIRYLLHDAKYTEEAYYNDYDLALDDETTRVRRLLVKNKDEIESALRSFNVSSSELQDVWIFDGDTVVRPTFDSALVMSPLEWYLDDRPEDSLHLWL